MAKSTSPVMGMSSINCKGLASSFMTSPSRCSRSLSTKLAILSRLAGKATMVASLAKRDKDLRASAPERK
eukprot:1523290-Heterocapsa_arctica.AAC.1